MLSLNAQKEFSYDNKTMRIWLNELSTKVGASKPTMKILKAFLAIILASLVTEVVSQSSTREYVGFHKLGTYGEK